MNTNHCHAQVKSKKQQVRYEETGIALANANDFTAGLGMDEVDEVIVSVIITIIIIIISSIIMIIVIIIIISSTIIFIVIIIIIIIAFFIPLIIKIYRI